MSGLVDLFGITNNSHIIVKSTSTYERSEILKFIL